jgi:hypothetical protein
LTSTRYIAAALAVVATGLVLAGCGLDDRPAIQTTTPAVPVPSEPTAATQHPDQDGDMRIEIAIGVQRFQARLDESSASRDLIDQLPVTLQMSDHGSVEKTGRLPSPLSTAGQPAGADPDIGDVGYYAPGNNLVLYYGDQSFYNGIVVIGQMDGDAAERIAHMDGPITATFSALND